MIYYDCTIISTRYGGSHEGGEWAAFRQHHHEIPDDVDGSDSECIAWWEANRDHVGVGQTPAAALADLEAKGFPIVGSE